MASLSGVFNLQEFTDLGDLGASYRLYTYAPGTTTLKVAYTDAAGTIPHTYTPDGLGGQYIALNVRGELPAPLFLASGGYDLTLKTPLGVTVWTRRAIGTSDGSDSLTAALANSSDQTKGDALVAVKKVGVTGALAITQHAVNEARTVNIALDFGLSPGNTRAQNDAALFAAINCGATSFYIPNGTYLLSAKAIIAAAALRISIRGESENTVLSWQIDTATTSKFGLLLDGFMTVENLTLDNTGTDKTNSAAILSRTTTVNNGLHDSVLRNVTFKGWGVPIGATIDDTTITMARSQVFACIFDHLSFFDCGRIQLGSGVNNNVWNHPIFWRAIGNRHIYLVEGGGNVFIAPQFESVAASVTSGFANCEFVRCPNNVLMTPYFEPCYGVIADSSPGTVIESPIIEGFDWTIGTLSSSAILRSTDANNGGYFTAPMVSRISTPVSRAATNPVSYCASDDNGNTVTLVDSFTSRDANFKLKPSGQNSKLAVHLQGGWTPSLIGTTAGGAGNTYSQRSGYYVRVGNLVTAWWRVALTAKDGALAGNAAIDGLPFAVATISGYGPSASLSEFFVDLSASYTQLLGEGLPATTRVLLVQGGDNVAALALPVAGINATTVIIGQLSYITDAP